MYRTYLIAGRHFIQRANAVAHAKSLGLSITFIKRGILPILDPRLEVERSQISRELQAEIERNCVANYVAEGLGEI